ncbi:MAG: pitrilysin family protein [Butyricicoccus sp.]|nr:pitrilysin family protein [Butyricicoccus sp.]
MKITLSNGVRIVTEHVDSVRSASVGIWVGNGSRHEPAARNGISHFIEHMIFKGTEKRSAQHIAIAMDALGGQFNAFTTKECTCYYMKVLDTHIKTGISILADMFLHSRFDPNDIALERGVVLEEIDMYEDTPEDVATEKLFESCFADSSLGRPILGTEQTLSTMTTETLHQYMQDFYRPADTVIAISGSFDQSDLDYICSLFEPMRGEGQNQLTPAVYHPQSIVRPKEIEQNHICIGFPGLPVASEQRYALQILCAIVGGGMSSRLFQTVREQNGLCYSIYSFCSSHHDTGMVSIYTALGKNTEERAIGLICKVLHEFCAQGPVGDELNRCREQLKANVLMGLENTSARMHQLGRGELYFGRAIGADELIASYDAVTADQVTTLARQLFDFSQASICAVGQTEPSSYYAGLLQ